MAGRAEHRRAPEGDLDTEKVTAGVLARLPRLTRKGRKKVYEARLFDALESDWKGFEPRTPDRSLAGLRDVPCASCPKFARFPARCTVPFGSRLRSCIIASTEYHLRDVRGKRVLELGCGESSFARRVVELAGGSWVGIDQRAGKSSSKSVRSIAARVPHIPFSNHSFDVVFGTQTIEHWEDPFTPGDLSYADAMAEIWRVLKPGGWIYFDGPIHLHGAREFIRGDVEKIRKIFDSQDWRNVRMLSWRRQHRPLAAHRAPERESARWSQVLEPCGVHEIEDLKRRPAWIIAIRAEKPRTQP